MTLKYLEAVCLFPPSPARASGRSHYLARASPDTTTTIWQIWHLMPQCHLASPSLDHRPLSRLTIGRLCHSWNWCCIIYHIKLIKRPYIFGNIDIAVGRIFSLHRTIQDFCLTVTPCNLHTASLCPISLGANGKFVSFMCVMFLTWPLRPTRNSMVIHLG